MMGFNLKVCKISSDFTVNLSIGLISVIVLSIFILEMTKKRTDDDNLPIDYIISAQNPSDIYKNSSNSDFISTLSTYFSLLNTTEFQNL